MVHSADDAQELRHFRRYLKQFLVACVVYGSIELGIGLWLMQGPLLLTGITTWCLALVILHARRIHDLREVPRAALTVAYAVLAGVAITAPFFTLIAPALALVPFVAMSGVLPYVGGRSMAILAGATLGTELLVAGAAAFRPSRPDLPAGLSGALSLSAMLVCCYLVLLLLLQLVARLRSALTQAIEAVRARDDFITMASHELRTPLTPMALNVEALVRVAEQASDGSSTAVAGKVQSIARQMRRLSRLVNELLDISRITARRFELDLRRVDLGALAREVLVTFEPEFVRSGCRVSLVVNPEPVEGHWDPQRIEQVLWNLMTNAMKFGVGKPIEVNITARNGLAALQVTDHGIGISKEDQKRIFEQFERAVSGQHYGGMGLGLWISRMIVESMGGFISVESSTGEGSTFTVCLPQALPASQGRAAPELH